MVPGTGGLCCLAGGLRVGRGAARQATYDKIGRGLVWFDWRGCGLRGAGGDGAAVLVLINNNNNNNNNNSEDGRREARLFS